MEIELIDLTKLLLAIALGGMVGAEREFRDKAAGFRTIIFICVGATLFTIFSMKMASASGADPTRIAANIVSGVGFLGAGVILRAGGRVVGITTASTVWLVAALGMGVGAGHLAFSAVATGVIMIVLILFPKIEFQIDSMRETRTYEVVCKLDKRNFQRLESIFEKCKLKVRNHKQMKRGDEMVCIWEVTGSRVGHDQLMAELFDDPEVLHVHA